MRQHALLIISLIVIASVALACGGGTGNVVQNNTSSSSAPAVTPPGSSSAGTSSSASSSGASGDFRSLLENSKGKQWTVSYSIQSAVPGANYNATTTQYVSGPGRVRTDTVSGGTETRLYDLGTTYTLCYNSGGGWRCTQSSAGARTQTDVINASAFADTARFDVAAAGTRSVAGVTAQCFNVTDKLAAATSVYCVSGEGVPLYIETTANSTTVTMTATNYATSVNDSDFVPPEEAAPQNGTPAVTPGGANVP